MHHTPITFTCISCFTLPIRSVWKAVLPYCTNVHISLLSKSLFLLQPWGGMYFAQYHSFIGIIDLQALLVCSKNQCHVWSTCSFQILYSPDPVASGTGILDLAFIAPYFSGQGVQGRVSRREMQTVTFRTQRERCNVYQCFSIHTLPGISTSSPLFTCLSLENGLPLASCDGTNASHFGILEKDDAEVPLEISWENVLTVSSPDKTAQDSDPK